MRRSTGRILFTATAAALTIGFAATSAFAATNLTVKVTGGGSFTSSSSNTVLTDGAVTLTCTGSKAGGSVATKTYTNMPSPVTVGSNSSLSFAGCTSITGAVTVKVHKLPYKVQVDSKTNSKGQTDGIISGVSTSVSTTGCSFNVTGSSPGYYTNSTHTLTLTPKPPTTPLTKAQLTVSGVKGCSGLVNNGDHPTFKGSYKLSRAIVITSS
jgi:hypothetical protein